MVWCTPAEVLARPAAERAEWFMPEAADECLDSLRLGNNSTSISDCLRIKLDEKDPGASLPAAKGMLCTAAEQRVPSMGKCHVASHCHGAMPGVMQPASRITDACRRAV